MLCASCLQASAEEAREEAKPRRRFPLAALCQLVIGMCVLSLLMYTAARMLLAVPDNFHDGSLWEALDDIE